MQYCLALFDPKTLCILSDRHSIVEIAAVADPNLAKMLWQRLLKNKQTSWDGWNEPWSQSNGLLLEYGHILTQGDRLGATILDQVRKRLNDKRDAELAILAATAAVAEFGGVVIVETLRSHLGLGQGDMARALERLVDEHLVRIDASGARLTGLHALRASAICSALIEIGYSTRLDQANVAISIVAPESLEACVGGLVACGAIGQTDAGAVIATRLVTSHVLSELASALRGLRGGSLTLLTQRWARDLQAHGIPPKLATAAAILGGSQSADLPKIGDLKILAERGRALFADAAAHQHDPVLVEALITTLAATKEAQPDDVADALGALAMAKLSDVQLSALLSIRLPFEKYSIARAACILDAAEAINPSLSAEWADPKKTNQPDLLGRLVAETPFALPAVREATDKGLIVHADIFEATLEPGENPNDRLFAYAQLILRVDQTAQVAHVRLVNASSEKSLHLDAEKRIPRENAPPDALAGSNRQIIDFVARAVGGDSWSAYLSRGEGLLVQGHNAFQRLLDGIMVGKADEKALETINQIVGECDSLIAPAGSSDDATNVNGRNLTPLQDLTFNLNGQLIIAVKELPTNAARTAARARDLIKRGSEAEREPWSLIHEDTPPILNVVRRTLNDIEIVALEAAASNRNPAQRWPKKNKKPKDAFSFVVRASRSALARRIEDRRSILETLLEHELPNAKVRSPSLTDGILWQSSYVATFKCASLEEFKSWMTEARNIGARISAKIQDDEDIAIVPLINGVVAIDYCYQLSRGKPNSMVAELLDATGNKNFLAAPEPKAIRRLGGKVVSHPPELEQVFLAFRDLSGMLILGLGQAERPTVERSRLEDALATIQVKGQSILDLFVDIDHPVISHLRALIEFAIDDSRDISDFNDDSSMDGLQTVLAELTWNRAH